MSGLVKRALLLGIAFQLSFWSLAVFFSPSISAAADAGTVLTTSPISIDLSTHPGQTATTSLQVQNNSTKSETISVKLAKFKVQGQAGRATIYTPSATDISTSWVHFSQNSFVAQPGVWTTITMNIAIPPYAALGYYYAVLFVPSTGAVNQQTDTNIVKGANAILVLVDTNSKNEQKQLSVSSFTTQKGLYEFLPVNFNITVHNSGNIHLIPQGDVYITRSKTGKTLASLPFNSAEGNVLPDSYRQFQASWTNGFPAFVQKRINGQIVSNSHGVPIQQLKWNWASSFSQIRFGKYYAHLVLVYYNGVADISVNSYVTFWVIPWKLILLVIFGIAAIIILWKQVKKLTKRLISKLKTTVKATD
jgi:hypothetical protein